MKSLFTRIFAFGIIAALALPTTALSAGPEASGITVSAKDLYQAFRRDATAARKKYYGKIITVTGILDTVGKTTGGELLTLERSTNCRVRRKSSELEDIKEAMKKERDRMEEARSWARDYDRDRRKRIVRHVDNNRDNRDRRGNFGEYEESMNPNGPRDENLLIDVSISGECKGIRSGKVYVDNCQDLSFTTSAGSREKALEKKK